MTEEFPEMSSSISCLYESWMNMGRCVINIPEVFHFCGALWTNFLQDSRFHTLCNFSMSCLERLRICIIKGLDPKCIWLSSLMPTCKQLINLPKINHKTPIYLEIHRGHGIIFVWFTPNSCNTHHAEPNQKPCLTDSEILSWHIHGPLGSTASWNRWDKVCWRYPLPPCTWTPFPNQLVHNTVLNPQQQNPAFCTSWKQLWRMPQVKLEGPVGWMPLPGRCM